MCAVKMTNGAHDHYGMMIICVAVNFKHDPFTFNCLYDIDLYIFHIVFIVIKTIHLISGSQNFNFKVRKNHGKYFLWALRL